MDHLRIDPKLRRQPKPKRAGWRGRLVFELLLQVSADFDLHGVFSPGRADPEWLADEWLTSRDDGAQVAGLLTCSIAQFIADGLADCLRANLLTRDGEALVVEGWAEFYRPTLTPAQRAASYRNRKAAESLAPPDDEGAAPRHAPSRAVTPKVTGVIRHATHITSHTSQDHDPAPPTEEPPPSPAFELKPAPAKKPRQKSAAIQFFEQAGKNRARALPDALPDDEWPAGRINAKLGPVVERLGVTGALAAHERFLVNPRARALKQGCPMWAFANDWPSYVNGPAAPGAASSALPVFTGGDLYADPK